MMATLRVRMRNLADRIDALSLRERGLIFLGVMGVLYFIAVQLVFAPLRAEHKQTEATLRAKHQETQALNTQLQSMLGMTGANADAAQRARIQTLQQELQALDRKLEQKIGGMVSPQQMAKLLEQVLTRSRGVKLVKMENLTKSLAMEQTVSANTSALGAVVYKHGVRIQVRGQYFELVEYLRTLESLPWKVSWGEVSLESETHPISTLTLEIYTWSRHGGWIGV
jgi:MSHA biogenesis protein MshJ